MPTRLRTADRYYRFSRRLARRAVKRVKESRTAEAAALVVVQHQAAQAAEVPSVSTAMLTEQRLADAPLAALNALAFTTSQADIERLLAEVQQDFDWQLERLVAGLVQDAGRAAQWVDVATRPQIAHVRHLNLPSCSRCAVLAGRVYRFSEGFERHPNCDCVMIPTTVANPDLAYDPAELARTGQIRGLSKADLDAIDAGADFGQVVNVRLRSSGLTKAGVSLTRAGRPTPAGIFLVAGDDRDRALALLARHGYIK